MSGNGAETVDWSLYLTGNECPICHSRIGATDDWINCEGWAEHRLCHDADVEES